MTNITKLFSIAIIASLTLISCGGGGNGSSGGGQGFEGTYNGQGSGTVSGNGSSAAFGGGFTVKIEDSGNASYIEAKQVLSKSKINGNKLKFTIAASKINQAGLRCTGSIVHSGSISGTTFKGTTSSSNIICNGIDVKISGNFSATKTAARSHIKGLISDMKISL